jgi:dipeptidase E
MPAERHIVAMGGFALGTPLERVIVRLAGRRRPRVAWIGTAGNESDSGAASFFEAWAGRATVSRIVFNPWPRADLREHALSRDVLYVGGGNTANMLAVWRVHGFDAVLREAWERGIVLCGWSAGMICWFEAGVTDSFGPHLEGLEDGLGFLPGSACPHYDGEERRRPVYTALVANGFPAGYAADDGVALHFVGTELAGVLTARRGATAYRVEADGEQALEARLVR